MRDEGNVDGRSRTGNMYGGLAGVELGVGTVESCRPSGLPIFLGLLTSSSSSLFTCPDD